MLAIVTGANKGLGLAIVKELCEKFNGTVCLTSRDEARGLAAVKSLQELGLRPIYHQLDVTDDASIVKFVGYIERAFNKVDLLINNAGILFLKDAKEPFVHQVEQTMFVNFFSLVNFTESILPLMKTGGTIINISSSSGHLSRIPSLALRKTLQREDLSLEELKQLLSGYIRDVKEGRDVTSSWGDSPYVVSKVGVNAYTFILHRRLADQGALVSCVHPGYVKSDMTRGGGTLSPGQAARAPVSAALGRCAGVFVWHDGTIVPWDGPDPRGYIDGKIL